MSLTFIEKQIKSEILKLYGVKPTSEFDVDVETRSRIEYLKRYVRLSKTKGIVLGISGGVDSTTAGKLAQIAMEELRKTEPVNFIAMRLPYKIQYDENFAKKAIDFINPDNTVYYNIGRGVDVIDNGISNSVYFSDIDMDRTNTDDFVKGNLKARIRMASQYHIAGRYNLLVLGTDHNAECVSGFYTKGGDGFCDMTVLNGLNKRQVRLISKHLGAPYELWSKKATADLEDENPMVSDEDALGYTYDQIDDFLEGIEIDETVQRLIINQYYKTIHKRNMPVEYKG